MFSERFVVAIFQNCGSIVDFVQKKVKLSWMWEWRFGETFSITVFTEIIL